MVLSEMMLCHEWFDDAAVDVGESEVSSLESVCELFVVDAHECEDGGVKVVEVCFVFSGVISEFIGSAVDVAGVDACTGHPHGEAVRVMVTAVAIASSLCDGGASKFTTPDDEGVFE